MFGKSIESHLLGSPAKIAQFGKLSQGRSGDMRKASRGGWVVKSYG
jgi:hypothetical protein